MTSPYIYHLHDIHGTPGAPVEIQGSPSAVVDGGFERGTMLVEDCSHIVVRDFNLCHSSADVVYVSRCEDFALERICAWDANPEENCMPIRVAHSERGRMTDCAAFGLGRKSVTFSYGGNHILCERCWARYDGWNGKGSHNRMTFNVAYNNFGNVFCGCIGECADLPEVYWHYRGCFGLDQQDSGEPVNTVVELCLAYSELEHVVGFHKDERVPGVHYGPACLDATNGKSVDRCNLTRLIAFWSESTMRSRIQEFAGVDPLERLTSLL